ncbi:MAG: sigma-70 family RNA polymerase sigma factor [Bryobacterales bacterium]|nr:sigma-70 family RNA polymerase sigma factor [Bryobacterales bacterium]
MTALFGQLRNPLMRYVRSLGVAAHDAEEVIQDVFLSLVQHVRGGKPRSNLPGWIFRVGRNLALRARQKRAWTETLDERLDPSETPEEAAVRRQRQQRLEAVLRALPERDRKCLEMRFQGMRYREIAEALGISLGAVALSLERSLKRLGQVE